MSELRKTYVGGTFFITLTIVGWIDIFTRKEYNDIIIDNLIYCQKNKGLEIFSYVIMPSHLHMIARAKNGSLNEILRDFKSFSAKKILNAIESQSFESRKNWLLHLFKYYAKYQKQNKKYMFWQKTNYPIDINNPNIFNQKINYIHQNPVNANIVTDESTYFYSSANPLSPIVLA